MDERVEQLQKELHSGDVDDGVFARVSQLGADLLHFRKVLLPARAVLTDLRTRRSLFLSEATQRFLGNMVGTVEHVLQDMLVDRDILSESLNLYMSMVGHRTNQVMKRLTVVSVVFLPLTFLFGVYGMNFEVLPELRWRFGYVYFWVVAVASWAPSTTFSAAAGSSDTELRNANAVDRRRVSCIVDTKSCFEDGAPAELHDDKRHAD